MIHDRVDSDAPRLDRIGDSALIEGVRPGERVVVSGSAALKAMLAGVGKS